MKVFILGERPTENSIKFYNLLGKQCDLTVAFQDYPIESKVWNFIPSEHSFKSVYLQGLNLGSTFGIGKVINEGAYDVYVIGGCESSAEKAAVKELIISGRKFIIAKEGAFPDVDESKLSKRRKTGILHNASFYLSSGSVSDAYLSSYNVDMSKVFRYNYAALSQKDFRQATPMTFARVKGLKKRYGLKENVFISTIDFNPEHGIDILLEIWKYAGIDNSTLLIISDGSEEKRLHKMVQNVALNDVVMLDYQPRELTRELIRISKAFIYPVRFDKWGLPVVEALSCGTPVISSYNVGAVHDLVRNDETGYIQNIHEPIGWSERMRNMVSREILWNKMRDDAYKSMKSFTIESRVKTYIEIFKKCAIIQKH